jgi:K+-sensing histidine kinase KdpD
MSSLVPFPPLADLPEFDISDLLQEVADVLELVSLRRRVPIEIDAPPYMMVHGERRQLRGLLIRLIGNALTANPAGSQIVVTAFSDEDGVEVEVADDRSESAELLLSEGLAAIAESGEARPMPWVEVQQIVAACGARISVSGCPEGGVATTVQFPRVRGKDAESRKAA